MQVTCKYYTISHRYPEYPEFPMTTGGNYMKY